MKLIFNFLYFLCKYIYGNCIYLLKIVNWKIKSSLFLLFLDYKKRLLYVKILLRDINVMFVVFFK